MDLEEAELDIEDGAGSDSRPSTALERIRQVSQALSDAARRKRLSSRRRGAYSGGGFQARSGARVMRFLGIASFCLIAAAPSLVAAIYLLFLASDQYVSEADFTVSGGAGPPLQGDGIGALTGTPLLAIIQDTQIVANFIHTRAAVEKLEQSVHLRSLYSDPQVDWWARSNPQSSIEKFTKYWGKMSDVSIVMPAGIVQLKVRAFTPHDAQTIAQSTVEACESLINEMNERMNRDAVANAEQELQRSSQRLAAALAALEVARNQSGMLETEKSAQALNKLADDAKAALLSMQGQYDFDLKYVSLTAPQMRELSSRIEVTKKQIAEIESKLISNGGGDPGETPVSSAMTRFGELDLERQVAERLFTAASAALEVARLNAEDKLMYLKTFVSPATPQEPQYPHRVRDTLIVFAASLSAWGLLCAFGATARNYMA